jgi:hypothetical protein
MTLNGAEDSGAAPTQGFGRGEEFATEVERGPGPLGQEPDAALTGDVRKALGNIGAAGEDDAFDPGADRRLGGAGIVAAIEERGRLRRRDSIARRPDQRAEPARSGIDTGIGRAGEGDRPPGLSRRAQRRGGVRERMDNNDGSVGDVRLNISNNSPGYLTCSVTLTASSLPGAATMRTVFVFCQYYPFIDLPAPFALWAIDLLLALTDRASIPSHFNAPPCYPIEIPVRPSRRNRRRLRPCGWRSPIRCRTTRGCGRRSCRAPGSASRRTWNCANRG